MEPSNNAKPTGFLEKLSAMFGKISNIRSNNKQLENLRSQSAVITENEAAEQRFDAIRRFQNQQAAEARAALKKQQRLRALGIGITTCIIVAIVVVTIWLVAEAVILVRKPVDPSTIDPKGKIANLTIGNYKCQTSKCTKVVDLPGDEILIHDGAYYIYNNVSLEAQKTSIDERDYRKAEPFYWKDNLMLILYPTTGHAGLFSLTDNIQVVDFSYDNFYSDPKDPVYVDMEWVVGNYIVAKQAKSFHLININTGDVIARGKRKVFIHDNYAYGYDDGGKIVVYNKKGKKILISSGALFVRDERVIAFKKNSVADFDSYDNTGKKDDDSGTNSYKNSLISEGGILANAEDFTKVLARDRYTYTVPHY